MSWSDCPVVETIPGKVSGVPLMRNSRVPAQTVVDNFNAGVDQDEIAKIFDLSEEDVREVIAFAREASVARPV